MGVLFFYVIEAASSSFRPTCSRCGRKGKGREGKGKERKGKERKEGVAEFKPNRRVQTSGRGAFRERGERKLVSRVDRSFCFAGHFANEERKKERNHWLLKV